MVFNGLKGAIMGTLTSGTPAAPIVLTGDTIKVGLLATATPYTPNNNDRFVSSVAASELTVSGYTGGFGGAGRKALTTRLLTVDDTNDWGKFTADNLTWTALAAGETIAYAFLFKELTSDALSPLVALFDLVDTPTNGGDITISWNASGILTLS